MKPGRLYEIAAILAVVVAFTAYYLYSVSTAPPDSAEGAFTLAIILAVVAALWACAAWMLVRRWWATTGAHLSTMDPPGRLLTGAVAALPQHRRDWGAAMLAELPQVEGAWRRWRFAFSCVRVALISPPAAGWPLTGLVAAIVVAAVAGTRSLALTALPSLEVFAVAFVALIGVLAVLGAARIRRVRLVAPFPIAIMAGGVTAAVVALTKFLLHYPAADQHLPPVAAIFVAVMLAAGLWLALMPPRSASGEIFAPHFGIAAAVLYGGLVVAVMHADRGTMFLSSLYLIAGVQILFFVGLIAAAVTRSFRAGLHAAAWAISASAIFIYAAWLPTATRFLDAAGRTQYDGEGRPIGDNLNDAMFMAFVVMPILAIPLGVLGAGFGAWARHRYSKTGVTS